MKWKFSLLTILIGSSALASNWTEPPEHTLGVKLGIQTPTLQTDITDMNDSNVTPITYRPSGTSRTMLGLTYGPFGAVGAVRNPVSADDQTRFGSSTMTDFQLRFYGRYGVWELFYQDYSGYYIDNSEQVDPTRSASGPKIQRPDIRSTHVGFQYTRSFSPEDYNMGAAFEHSIYQTASGGSWLAVAHIDQHRITADAPLIPTQLTAQYPSLDGFKGGDFLTFRGGGGYGYNYIWGDTYYLAGVLTVSIGSQKQNYVLTATTESRWQAVAGGTGKLGIGSNGSKYFWGLNFTYDTTSIQIGSAKIDQATTEGTLFWGFRWEEISIPPLDSLSNWLFSHSPNPT